MSHRHDILAIIPARGGSKGLPGKNIRPLLGKPLLTWTIEAALHCPRLDRVILSSDNAEIIAIAREAGCEAPFVRPAPLATDGASAMAVVWHVCNTLEKHYGWVVWLQPTSPLRTSDDIAACLALCLEGGAPAAVSMTPVAKPPHWMVTLDQAGHPHPLLGDEWHNSQRQETPPVYLPNGAVYVANIAWLAKTGTFLTPESAVYLMPPERSIDIDTATDFRLAEIFLEERQYGHL